MVAGKKSHCSHRNDLRFNDLWFTYWITVIFYIIFWYFKHGLLFFLCSPWRQHKQRLKNDWKFNNHLFLQARRMWQKLVTNICVHVVFPRMKEYLSCCMACFIKSTKKNMFTGSKFFTWTRCSVFSVLVCMIMQMDYEDWWEQIKSVIFNMLKVNLKC